MDTKRKGLPLKKMNELQYVVTKTTGRLVMIDSYCQNNITIKFGNDIYTIYEYFLNSFLKTMVMLERRMKKKHE